MDAFELLRQLVKEEKVKLDWNPQTKTIVVVVSSEKGGVGKTSVVNALAAVMGAAGFRVLVIDLDPRATATEELGIENPEFSVNDLLYVNHEDNDPPNIRGMAEQAILPAGEGWPETVHVLAAERALGHRESDPTAGLEQRLKLALEGVAEGYDIILVDVPPRPGGRLVAAALVAATHALLPATLDEDGYIGVRDALLSIARTRTSIGLPPLTIVGIVRNIVDRRRTGLAELYDGKLAQEYPATDDLTKGQLLADVAIPKYVVRQEARSACIPFTAANSPEAELLERACIKVLNHISRVA